MKFKNKEELSKAYNELEKAYTKECQENKKLREQLKLVESDQSKIWQPKVDEKYWIVDGDGEIAQISHYYSNQYIDYGSYFKSKEEAEKQAEYNRVMNRFRKYVEAYSDPLDWDRCDQWKWWVKFDTCTKTLKFDITCFNPSQFQVYASSEEVLKNAIIYSAGSEEEFIRIVFGEDDE